MAGQLREMGRTYRHELRPFMGTLSMVVFGPSVDESISQLWQEITDADYLT